MMIAVGGSFFLQQLLVSSYSLDVFSIAVDKRESIFSSVSLYPLEAFYSLRGMEADKRNFTVPHIDQVLRKAAGRAVIGQFDTVKNMRRARLC